VRECLETEVEARGEEVRGRHQRGSRRRRAPRVQGDSNITTMTRRKHEEERMSQRFQRGKGAKEENAYLK
jgi:hypothetical protein